MSTYANGTQQTYQQIWAGMELTCARLMPAIRSAATETTALALAAETAAAVTPAPIEWPEPTAGGHTRKHPLRSRPPPAGRPDALTYRMGLLTGWADYPAGSKEMGA
jgi:hypothetical protein